MRIGIVDHVSVSGGIIRYSTNLAKSLCEIDKSNEVTFFTTEKNFKSNRSLFESSQSRLKIKILKSTRKSNTGIFFADKILNRFFYKGSVIKRNDEIYQETKNFDLVYFTYPHASDFIKVKPPAFATFHDLNWKYLFGTPLYSKRDVEMIGSDIEKWLNGTRIIVSTPYVEKEIRRFYPQLNRSIEVIYLSNLAKKVTISKEMIQEVRARLGLPEKYILYPAHLMPHKNHNMLFSAFSRFKSSGESNKDYKLVLSGYGSDFFRYGKAIHRGLELSNVDDFDVLGLGYLTNEEVDVVIKNADLIISTSLEEAGSGPGLDAWVNGIPVILSNIGAHKDQLDFFKIECTLFDPMDIYDMSDKMDYAIKNLSILKRNSEAASVMLDRYSWDIVARKYMDYFVKSIANGD
jgi:glycosyltransferase involved in cell wall biosynthesis